MCLAGGQLVVGRLPEQLAGGRLDAHHHALVAFDIRAQQAAVVGADEDLTVRYDRIAVGRGP